MPVDIWREFARRVCFNYYMKLFGCYDWSIVWAIGKPLVPMATILE